MYIYIYICICITYINTQINTQFNEHTNQYINAQVHTFKQLEITLTPYIKNVFSYYRMCSLTIECVLLDNPYSIHKYTSTLTQWATNSLTTLREHILFPYSIHKYTSTLTQYINTQVVNQYINTYVHTFKQHEQINT